MNDFNAASGLRWRRPGEAHRIVVVEDDRAIRSICERMLRRAGHEVLSFNDPRAVLGALGAAFFDVLVTDMVMPGLSGEELVERLRQAGHEPRVIFMSGQIQEDVIGRGREPHCLAKPFSPKKLVALVDQLLTQEESKVAVAQ